MLRDKTAVTILLNEETVAKLRQPRHGMEGLTARERAAVVGARLLEAAVARDEMPPVSMEQRAVHYTPDALRRRREHLGYTIAAVARMMSVSRSMIYKWENGQRRCPPPSWGLVDSVYGETA